MARLVYLLAASHSGSTLLAMLLGAHPEICTVGELKATGLGNPDRYRCSCRRLIGECEFWRKLEQAMAGRGISDFQISRAGTSIHEVDSRLAQRLLAPLFRGPVLERIRDFGLILSPRWRRHLAATQRRNLALVESLQAISGAKWVVDSSKIALRLKYLLRIPSLEIKVVRVIRDGRAVALTYTDEARFADAADPGLRGGGTGERRVNAQDNIADAANEWKRSNESADCLVAGLPDSQWMEVRYEELCRQPAATLRCLSEFLGVDPARLNLDFRAREQHVIGNGMRLDSTSEIRLDERWKTHLSSADIEVFEKVAGRLNRRYGYA